MSARVLPSAQPSFLHSQRRLARMAQPITRFLHIEAAGGILLLAATLVALVWANSPWSAAYDTLWHTEIRMSLGSRVFAEDLGHLVNDALMALFFFVVGMEIKREVVIGELRDRRKLAVPVFAAVGGMVTPAVIFVALNAGGPGSRGWGIPMATDIAFAVAVLALLGRRVPGSLKVLLLTLAIVDDLGAITVIAVFYSERVRIVPLVVAVALVGLVVMLYRLGVTYAPVFVFVGIALWFAVYESGVHATIAGVAMGLATPARPRQTALQAEEVVDVLERLDDIRAEDVRRTATAIGESVSNCDRWIAALHPWTGYVIVPIFALANAGIELSADTFTSHPAVLMGVAVGLVAGKFIGVVGFSWLAVRLRLGALPDAVRWTDVAGMAALAGIGFTVSLFVTNLAFDDAVLQGSAKAGVLVASVVAALVGTAILRLARRPAATASSSGPSH